MKQSDAGEQFLMVRNRRNSSTWLETVGNGLGRFGTTVMVQNGSDQSGTAEQVQKGLEQFRTAHNGSERFRMAGNSSEWFVLVQNGSERFGAIRNSSEPRSTHQEDSGASLLSKTWTAARLDGKTN